MSLGFIEFVLVGSLLIAVLLRVFRRPFFRALVYSLLLMASLSIAFVVMGWAMRGQPPYAVLPVVLLILVFSIRKRVSPGKAAESGVAAQPSGIQEVPRPKAQKIVMQPEPTTRPAMRMELDDSGD